MTDIELSPLLLLFGVLQQFAVVYSKIPIQLERVNSIEVTGCRLESITA